MRIHRLPFLALLLALFVSGCTGPAGGQEPTQPEEPTPEEDALPVPSEVNLAAYEDFDAAPYREEAPGAGLDLAHDVPEALMEGRADAGITREVPGFRVQIYSTQDRGEAEDILNQAIGWWNTVQRNEDAPGYFPEVLPVDIRYRQPYYRVRVGNFTSRAQADRALQYLRERYPDAFITPDTVTIRR